jgi:hypothetical protein
VSGEAVVSGYAGRLACSGEAVVSGYCHQDHVLEEKLAQVGRASQNQRKNERGFNSLLLWF